MALTLFFYPFREIIEEEAEIHILIFEFVTPHCTMKQNPLAGFISGICVIFMILNQFLGYFMFGDPKTTPKVMLIIIYFPFPNAKFENG